MHSYLTSVWLLTALGPDHMAVYVSPASDVDLLTSSLGPLLPIQDGGDGVVYFIYYSHGTDVGSWELLLELLVSWTITVLTILMIDKSDSCLTVVWFCKLLECSRTFCEYIYTHLCGSWGSCCCWNNDCIESYTERELPLKITYFNELWRQQWDCVSGEQVLIIGALAQVFLHPQKNIRPWLTQHHSFVETYAL